MTPEQVLLIKALSSLAMTVIETIQKVQDMSEEEVRDMTEQVELRAAGLMSRLNNH